MPAAKSRRALRGVAVIEKRPYPASAQATEPSAIAQLPRDAILTRQGLADMTGTTVEATIRIVSRWLKDRVALVLLVLMGLGNLWFRPELLWVPRLQWKAALVILALYELGYEVIGRRPARDYAVTGTMP